MERFGISCTCFFVSVNVAFCFSFAFEYIFFVFFLYGDGGRWIGMDGLLLSYILYVGSNDILFTVALN